MLWGVGKVLAGKRKERALRPALLKETYLDRFGSTWSTADEASLNWIGWTDHLLPRGRIVVCGCQWKWRFARDWMASE